MHAPRRRARRWTRTCLAAVHAPILCCSFLRVQAGEEVDEDVMAQEVVNLVRSTGCHQCLVWAKSDAVVRPPPRPPARATRSHACPARASLPMPQPGPRRRVEPACRKRCCAVRPWPPSNPVFPPVAPGQAAAARMPPTTLTLINLILYTLSFAGAAGQGAAACMRLSFLTPRLSTLHRSAWSRSCCPGSAWGMS